MAEVLGFEQKIQGLIALHQALGVLDPRSPHHSDIADPELFYYADGYHASRGIVIALDGIVTDMQYHARHEYSSRGYNLLDLRDDTEELRAERASVLAVMTAPLETGVREQRAERIAGLLSAVSTGAMVRLTNYNSYTRQFSPPDEVRADVGRALFGVFRNGHISSRSLTIQYDTASMRTSIDHEKIAEQVMDIEVPDLFETIKPTGTYKLQAEIVAV